MTEESKRERELTFERIRNQANGHICEVIKNCNYISRLIGLGDVSLPNVIISYNNKIIALEKEFTKANIDFYDRLNCETRFAIEQKLQGLILEATSSINHYLFATQISIPEFETFVASHQKPTFFEKHVLGKKYEPQKSLYTPEKLASIEFYIDYYKNCNEKIQDFSLKNNIIESILFYRTLSITNGVSVADFDARIDKMDYELQLIGYKSIKEIIYNEIKDKDLNIKALNCIPSISIPD